MRGIDGVAIVVGVGNVVLVGVGVWVLSAGVVVGGGGGVEVGVVVTFCPQATRKNITMKSNTFCFNNRLIPQLELNK